MLMIGEGGRKVGRIDGGTEGRLNESVNERSLG